MTEIENYARKNYRPDYSNPLQAARAALQGLTFGFSDEMGAGLAALAATVGTDTKWSDAYETIHRDLERKRMGFAEDNPATALGLEVAGGIATGGAGASRVLGGQGFRNASNIQKMLRTAGVGGAEGAVYGAGQARPGERVEGAAKGGVLGAAGGPVLAGAANVVGRGLGAVGNYAGRKLTQTPNSQATQVLRDMAEATGMTADDAIEEMRRLGPEAALADLNDGMRVLARAGMNRQGTMREAGKDMVNRRQRGQQKRLLKAIEDTAEGEAAAYKTTLTFFIADRAKQAAPLYDAAFEKGVQMSPKLAEVMNDPILKRAINQGKKWAKSDGTDKLLNVLHEAKLSIDDKIGKAMRNGEKNLARKYLQRKSELMDAIAEQNPEYIQAAKVFSDQSAFINAMEMGKDFIKRDAEELADMLRTMPQSEIQLFRLGAVKALGDRLDRIGENRNAVMNLLGTKAMRDKLSLVMDDPTPFLRRAGIEADFSETRNMLTGNSTTALQQQAGETLDQAIDGGLAKAIAERNPSNIIGQMIDTVTRGKASPEMINQLGDMMLRQGMDEREIRRIFTSPALREALGDQYDQIIGPVIRGGAAPALVSAQG